MEWPRPKPTTRFRVIGPKEVNGMKVWTVHDLVDRRQVGPPCFSVDEVLERLNDALAGKVWFGGTRMRKKKVV